MKLLVSVLVIRFVMELLSTKNEKKESKTAKSNNEVLHPAAHQLR